jgi:NitT/TauT family transport system permease protein
MPVGDLGQNYSGANIGLGQLLHYGRELNAMEQVIGIMLVIVAIGLLADKALFAPWERFLHRRWGTGGAVAT